MTDNTKLRSPFITSSVDHPRLSKTDATSIRKFLRSYDQYAKEIEERARQHMKDDSFSGEAVTPVHLKFCVDAEWIESLIELGFIDKISSYDDLTDNDLREYLEEKATESKEVLTLERLDKIAANNLRIDMTDINARSRIENLFISYQSLLRRNGLS